MSGYIDTNMESLNVVDKNDDNHSIELFISSQETVQT